jgi:tetratricopeptide (TPR) repeat protein
MTPEVWQRVKRIVGAAHERPAAERRAFVAAACAGDAGLEREVESLLRSTEAASALYELPALSLPGAGEALFRAAAPGRVGEGDRIGPYRVVREIGHGGMGAVYLAERADGEFDRQVAVKFVGGARTAAMLQRFREERRILAALHHPNIAGLIDGGATEDGSPYVIMEYVAGAPIDEYCDRAGLPIRERVQLFLPVCAAVQYAHRMLVIHRDIKPSNILVTADGTPKLLDFGIATFVAGTTGRAATVRALTPESASPEQLRGELITVSSDVYALGVLLYRLVAGRSPYGDATASDAALVRAICDEMPPPPGADRDLDAIVLKALRKEPERRYTSVEQLAGDLQRYLSGRPVLAGPDSARYRAGKFLRRHRMPAAAAAVALLAVLAGAAIAVYQAGVARRERALAERRLADIRHLANAFVFEFHDAIADLPGTLNARKLVVARAAEYLDRLARESHNDVALQRELATAYVRLGDITGGAGISNLGDVNGAMERYATALRIREALAARGVAEPADIEGLAEIHVRLSRAAAGRGELERAEASARAAVSLLQPQFAAAAGSPPPAGQVATAYQQLGYVQLRAGRAADAAVSLREALDRGGAALAAQPGNARETARLARIGADYGDALLALGRTKEALHTLEDAQDHLERLLASEPLNQRYQQTLVLVRNLRGSALERLGDAAGAIIAFRGAADIADGLRRAAPEDQSSRIAAALSHHSLGAALAHQGNVEGIEHLRFAFAEMRDLAGTAPGDWSRFQMAAAALELADALFRVRPSDPAVCREIGPGLEAWRELVARDRVPDSTARARFARLAARCGPS